MLLSHSIEIAGDGGELFATLKNSQALAHALGSAAEVTHDTVRGSTDIAIGPWNFSFAGTIDIASSDAATQQVVFHVDGAAPERGSLIRGEVTVTVAESSDGTRLQISSDIGTAGALAQFSDSVFSAALHECYARIAQRAGGVSRDVSQFASPVEAAISDFEAKSKSLEVANASDRPRGWRRRR